MRCEPSCKGAPPWLRFDKSAEAAGLAGEASCWKCSQWLRECIFLSCRDIWWTHLSIHYTMVDLVGQVKIKGGKVPVILGTDPKPSRKTYNIWKGPVVTKTTRHSRWDCKGNYRKCYVSPTKNFESFHVIYEKPLNDGKIRD